MSTQRKRERTPAQKEDKELAHLAAIRQATISPGDSTLLRALVMAHAGQPLHPRDRERLERFLIGTQAQADRTHALILSRLAAKQAQKQKQEA